MKTLEKNNLGIVPTLKFFTSLNSCNFGYLNNPLIVAEKCLTSVDQTIQSSTPLIQNAVYYSAVLSVCATINITANYSSCILPAQTIAAAIIPTPLVIVGSAVYIGLELYAAHNFASKASSYAGYILNCTSSIINSEGETPKLWSCVTDYFKQPAALEVWHNSLTEGWEDEPTEADYKESETYSDCIINYFKQPSALEAWNNSLYPDMDQSDEECYESFSNETILGSLYDLFVNPTEDDGESDDWEDVGTSYQDACYQDDWNNMNCAQTDEAPSYMSQLAGTLFGFEI